MSSMGGAHRLDNHACKCLVVWVPRNPALTTAEARMDGVPRVIRFRIVNSGPRLTEADRVTLESLGRTRLFPSARITLACLVVFAAAIGGVVGTGHIAPPDLPVTVMVLPLAPAVFIGPVATVAVTDAVEEPAELTPAPAVVVRRHVAVRPRVRPSVAPDVPAKGKGKRAKGEPS